MITADQLRMNVLHKLIDIGWYAVACDGAEIITWCIENLGPEYFNTVIPAIQNSNGKWLAARMRTDHGWQWFCAFKHTEDLMWYRMQFNCTVVDKSTHVV